MQDYKSLCAAVTISATRVNIQADIHTQRAFWPAYMNSSAKMITYSLSDNNLYKPIDAKWLHSKMVGANTRLTHHF